MIWPNWAPIPTWQPLARSKGENTPWRLSFPVPMSCAWATPRLLHSLSSPARPSETSDLPRAILGTSAYKPPACMRRVQGTDGQFPLGQTLTDAFIPSAYAITNNLTRLLPYLMVVPFFSYKQCGQWLPHWTMQVRLKGSIQGKMPSPATPGSFTP